MDNSEYSGVDVKVNHSVGCQFFYMVIAIIMAIVAAIYIYEVGENKWYRFLFAPLVLIGSIYGIYYLAYRFIKERIKKIPAYTVTRNSLVVARKNSEYNEIPFDAIEQFKLRRVRTRRNNRITYIDIYYKDDCPENSSKFEKIDRIDCSGLTMRSDKLLSLLRERLNRYNEKNQELTPKN